MESVEDYGLLVVDIQGKLAQLVYDSDLMITQTQKLIKCCKLLSIPIITLEQNPRGLGRTLPELAELLVDSPTLEKHHFNGLSESDIRRTLLQSGMKKWLVVGIEAHICVYQTIQGLLDNNLEPVLISDCVSSRVESNKQLAVSKLQAQGVELSSVEMFVYQLMGTSDHPKFREVLDAIK